MFYGFSYCPHKYDNEKQWNQQPKQISGFPRINLDRIKNAN